MPVKIILILALLASLITSLSLIDPPGCTIIFTHAINGLHESDFVLAAKIDKISNV